MVHCDKWYELSVSESDSVLWGNIHDIRGWYYYCTVKLHYNIVNCLDSTHNRHPIACLKGQAMGCLLWVQMWAISWLPHCRVLSDTLWYSCFVKGISESGIHIKPKSISKTVWSPGLQLNMNRCMNSIKCFPRCNSASFFTLNHYYVCINSWCVIFTLLMLLIGTYDMCRFKLIEVIHSI